MYGWENAFINKIMSARKDEHDKLYKMQKYISVTIGIGINTPYLCSGIIFICYGLAGNKLTASNIFPALYLLNSTRIVLGYMFGQSIKFLAGFAVTKKRIETILKMKDLV